MKFLASVISYISGIPGGIFAPPLTVGARLGQAIGQVLIQAPASAIVLLGMFGYFSGVVRMTVPLMATALLAYAVSRLVCRRPLHATLARRFLVCPKPATEGLP